MYNRGNACCPLALRWDRIRFEAVWLSTGSHNRLGRAPPAGGRGDKADDNLPLRSYVDTAVYVDRLACDVVAVFYQVTDGPGDLFRLPEAAEGHLFTELLLGFLGDIGDHISLYESGAEGVNGDPEAGQFLGGGLGEAEQAGFGRRVVGLAYIAGLSDEGAHVDDLAPALVRHVRQHRVDRVEGAVEVYLYDLVPVVDGEFPERAVYDDPCVVDQDVYPVELLDRLIYQVLGLLRVRDVGLNRDGLPTALRDLVHQLLGRLLAPGVVDDDFGSTARQLLRYGFAQTPARAGHDNNGFFQSAHTILPLQFVCEIEFIDWRNQAQTRYHTHVHSATRGELSSQSADIACPGDRNMETVERFGRAPHIPLGSDTTSPKDDRIWAKMYCVFMFDRQIFSEHRYESFIRDPTSDRRSR